MKKVSKEKLASAVDTHKTEMHEVVEAINESITAKGQRKKLAANAKFMSFCERYGVEFTE